nr:MAG TPA: hypothetical protein [Caudoviricetes sp.]
MVDLSRRPSLDISPVLWRCLYTVLLTPTTGGLRHRHQAFFLCPFQKSRFVLSSVSCYKSICCRVWPICPSASQRRPAPPVGS